MRKVKTYKIQNIQEFKKKLLAWCDQFEKFSFLDSNDYRHINNSNYSYNSFELLATNIFSMCSDLILVAISKLVVFILVFTIN